MDRLSPVKLCPSSSSRSLRENATRTWIISRRIDRVEWHFERIFKKVGVLFCAWRSHQEYLGQETSQERGSKKRGRVCISFLFWRSVCCDLGVNAPQWTSVRMRVHRGICAKLQGGFLRRWCKYLKKCSIVISIDHLRREILIRKKSLLFKNLAKHI